MSAPPVDVSRDPELLRRLLPVLDRHGPGLWARERVPEDGPFMVVGNHSGGVYMPDFWAFLSEWIRRRGPEAPIVPVGYDFVFSLPGLGGLARRLGVVPASQKRASELLEAGHPILVYPGGDSEVYRPWTERYRVDLHGHAGFVRLALRRWRPGPPRSRRPHRAMAAPGRWLGIDRLRQRHADRCQTWGSPATWRNLPTKVTARVLRALNWIRHFGLEAADDPGAPPATRRFSG
ncbi:MAG: 1-acyl-sn-glycerol-3-phosphate acyltransferase [Candidatus Microthrix sp.]|nr:1-acyl-sn-glycerol-3-phosphate acyltransferase [Candidatus Microthrix sp.]